MPRSDKQQETQPRVPSLGAQPGGRAVLPRGPERKIARGTQGAVLAQVLCEVPNVLETLPSPALKNLLASSTQLRKQIHAFAASVHLKRNFPLLVAGNWHGLQSLVCMLAVPGMYQISFSDWLHFRKLDLSGNLPVRSFTAKEGDTVAIAISYLVQGEWPMLETLDLSFNRLSAQAMAHLKQGNWPLLKDLFLRNCFLDAKGIEQLVADRWSQLQTLDLKSNPKTDANVMSHLRDGDWPLLQRLSMGMGMGPAAICHLTVGDWSNLQDLELQKAQFSPGSSRSFSIAEWPQLARLQLYNCSLKTESICWLVQADWPMLHQLDLTSTFLGAAGFEILSQGNWPALAIIVLVDTGIDRAGMAHMNKGAWPELGVLDFSGNDPGLDHVAVLEFASGSWPNLWKLGFSCHASTTVSVMALATGKWPLLRALDLSNCDLSTASLQQLLLGRWPLLECLVVGLERYDAASLAALQSRCHKRLQRGENRVKGGWTSTGGGWPCLQLLVLGNCSDLFECWE